MRKHFRAAAFAMLATLSLSASNAVTANPSQSKPTTTGVRSEYGNIPLQFEANQGQSDKQVKFLSRGGGYGLFLTPSEAVLALSKPAEVSPAMPFAKHAPSAKVQPEAVRMKLLGANASPMMTGQDELPGKVNYFIGDDPKKWRTNIATYKKVRYHSVYKGVDLVYYGNQKHLEYDFIVAPGADPKSIRVSFSGAQTMHINGQGELVLALRGGDIRWQLPVVYQEVAGVRVPVKGGYVLNGMRQVGFQVASYDRKKPLVIDPVLLYSTYLGGSSVDIGTGIALDGGGNMYVIGSTYSTDFPLRNPFESINGSSITEIFVSKLNAAGSALVYSTYLGGSGDNRAHGLAVDSGGSAYIAGYTSSTDFPVRNPLQTTSHGGSGDAFVTKLNAAGTALVYSTYLGGTGDDQANSITVDGGGNAYVTGMTYSTDFPLKNALQAVMHGTSNGFISKLNAAGTALAYSTYLGGSGNDQPNAIAVDGSGSVYVAGYTDSADYPLQNPLQAVYHGVGDAFVTKLSAAGTALVYSTYLGGNQDDIAWGIAVDGGGNAYVGGNTLSSDFPAKNPIHMTHHGGKNWGEGFVTKLNAAGSAMVYSTTLSGSDDDRVTSIAVDGGGNAYAAGITMSFDFPFINPIQAVDHGGLNEEDGFITKINSSGTALIYSTYFGGGGDETLYGLAIDSTGNAYVAGGTDSTDLALQNPLQGANHGESNLFVAKIGERTAFGDFNGDGKWDLVLQNTSNNQIAAWFMNGAAVTGGQYISLTPVSGWKAAAEGDFNGDGKADIVLQNVALNKATLWGLNGVAYVIGQDLSIGIPAGWSIAASGDFNGDGKPDLVLQNATTNKAAIWYMNGASVTGSAYTSLAPPAGYRVAGVGDFDGDGKSDLVLQNSTLNKIAIWYMNGAAVAGGTYTSVSPPACWSVAGVGDFNGDGKPDIVLQDSSTNKVAIWYMNGSAVLSGAYTSVTPSAAWKVIGPR